MVENGGEITAPISISLEFQMRSDSSLLPFYSYADYCKIEKHTISQCISKQSLFFYSRPTCSKNEEIWQLEVVEGKSVFEVMQIPWQQGLKFHF